MPRQISALATRFDRDVDKALDLPRKGELIRTGSPKGSVALRELTPYRLEALYEFAYLRVILAWEQLMEEAFLRYLCGCAGPGGVPNLISAPFARIEDAHRAIFAGRDYLLWYPDKAVKRSQAYFTNGPIELVLSSSFSRLEWIFAIRHRIAHVSDHARVEFDKATMGLAGRRFPGSRPGAFLRSHNSPTERWLDSLGRELSALAHQLAT